MSLTLVPRSDSDVGQVLAFVWSRSVGPIGETRRRSRLAVLVTRSPRCLSPWRAFRQARSRGRGVCGATRASADVESPIARLFDEVALGSKDWRTGRN